MPKKKPVSKNSTANVHIRLPAEEKAAFMKAAESSGFDFTTWIRLGLRKLAGLDKR